MTFLGERAGAPIATRAGFVNTDEVRAFGWQPTDEVIDVTVSRTDGAEGGDLGVVFVGDIGDRYDDVDAWSNMRKVLVIGSGGAGKSTLARHLGELLHIDVIHLDALSWHPGWTETPRAEWRKIIEGLLRRDAWIIDGNYSNTLDIRLEECDTVIFLDIARRICL